MPFQEVNTVYEKPRRRSPGWVREMSDRELHQIGFRFAHERQEVDLSDAQEWLWDAIISELEYRRRRARPAYTACACELCFSPFPFPEEEEPF